MPRVAPLHRALGSIALAGALAGEARFPFRSPRAIQRAQRRRLARMVEHAYRTVPYWRAVMRARSIRPADIRTVSDLARLPVIDRTDLRRDPERFRSTSFDRAELLALASGGSTGEPITIWHDITSVRDNAAHGERDRAPWAGTLVARVGYKEAVVGLERGADHAVQRFLRERVWIPRRPDIERRYFSALAPIEQTLAALDAFRPEVIHAYGSFLEAMVATLDDTGRAFRWPKVITTSSDALNEATRRRLEHVHGVPVYATYEAVEAFKIGFECERRDGFHLNVDLYPVRVDAATGEVTVSNLVNRATVLFNYRIGDLATLARVPCPCGRALPLLAHLDGRSDDFLQRSDGSCVLPLAVTSIFAVEPGVRQYQIDEWAPRRFKVSIVAGRDCDAPSTIRRIGAGFAREVGDDVDVEIAFVERIATTPGGKVRRLRAWSPTR